MSPSYSAVCAIPETVPYTLSVPHPQARIRSSGSDTMHSTYIRMCIVPGAYVMFTVWFVAETTLGRARS